jgi:hypothetical protein
VGGPVPAKVWVTGALLYLATVAELSLLLPGGGRVQMLLIAAVSLALGLIRAPRGIRLLATLTAAVVFISVPANDLGLVPAGGPGRGLVWAAYFLLPMLIGASLARAVAILRTGPGEPLS